MIMGLDIIYIVYGTLASGLIASCILFGWMFSQVTGGVK